MNRHKRSRFVFALFAALLAIGLMTGCSKPAAEPPAPKPPAAEAPSPQERVVTVTDMSGDEVTIEGEVKSIVNLWPAGTSSFFAMGAGDLISGLAVNSPATMNEWTTLFYPKAKDIPALGGTSPSVEEIAALQPDLVIIHPTTASTGFAQQVRDAGIPAININFDDYETMIQAYTVLGEVLGGDYQKKLDAWCDEVETKLASVRSWTGSLTADQRPVVYYAAGQTPALTVTMSAGTIIEDWVTTAGGEFASKALDLTGQEATPEAIFQINPDVIMIGGVFQHDLMKIAKTDQGWSGLKAATNGRIYNNPYGCFNWDRFGLESNLQIHYALLRIQPEIAAENCITEESMVKEIQDFYSKYADYELTAEQAQNMFDGLTPAGEIAVPPAPAK